MNDELPKDAPLESSPPPLDYAVMIAIRRAPGGVLVTELKWDHRHPLEDLHIVVLLNHMIVQGLAKRMGLDKIYSMDLGER